MRLSGDSVADVSDEEVEVGRTTLSGSPGLAHAIQVFAEGHVDPRPLVGATVGLAIAPEVLAGGFRGGDAPKIQIDPRL